MDNHNLNSQAPSSDLYMLVNICSLTQVSMGTHTIMFLRKLLQIFFHIVRYYYLVLLLYMSMGQLVLCLSISKLAKDFPSH
jgi:hypothetical protein